MSNVRTDEIFRNVTKLIACAGKHKHSSMAAAINEVTSARKRNQPGRVKNMEIRAYKCEFCDGYHVGHAKRGTS